MLAELSGVVHDFRVNVYKVDGRQHSTDGHDGDQGQGPRVHGLPPDALLDSELARV